MNIRNISLAILTMCLTAACGSMGMGGNMMPGAMAQGDIASIVTTANEGEIQQGQAALGSASSADVRQFAQMMVNDHTAALSTARETFSRASVTPNENETSRTLRENSQRSITNLTGYRGAAFDRTYMQMQVDEHQWLLTNLDSVLIPSARGEVRTLLENQRAAVATHLQHARDILGRL
jgi:putative membrane protein